MLDTYGRKYMNPFINYGAKVFVKLGLSPNNVTILALIMGVFTSFFIYFDYKYIAVIVLWISGYLDAVDGAMARKLNKTSSFGTVMDITFDRIVEISIILSLALKFKEATFSLLILSTAILISMTIFLTVGAVSEKKGIKSFYYQAGVAERTEGFILFSLMIVLTQWMTLIVNVFSVIVLITALQRLLEAKRILR